MKIKTWQERLDETTQGVDWITAHTIQIKFMKAEIDELRDTLQVKSGMWCGIEKKWQEKYEALLRGTPASAWISVDDGLPDVKLDYYEQFLVIRKYENNPKMYVSTAFYLNQVCCDGDESEFGSDCDDSLPLSGWFVTQLNDNWDEMFSSLADAGYKIIKWQPMPTPPGEQK